MKYLLTLTLLLFTSSVITAQERIHDEKQARAIFEEVDDRRNSIQSETAIMEMVITDNRGRTRSRTMQSWIKNDSNDTSSLIVFSAPGNVRGTGFLSVNEGGSTTQRLYLPSVGRIQTYRFSRTGRPLYGQ